MTELPHQNAKAPIEFVSLTAGGQGFCVDIHSIREIRGWTPVTSLPHSNGAVLGVINLRGAVVPIIDLRARLGLGETPDSRRNVIVIVSISGRIMGLLVEAVSEIITVEPTDILDNPTSSAGSDENFIVGLISQGDQMLRVLDIDVLLTFETSEAA